MLFSLFVLTVLSSVYIPSRAACQHALLPYSWLLCSVIRVLSAWHTYTMQTKIAWSEFFPELSMKIEVFWDITQCEVIIGHWRFGRAYWVYLQGSEEDEQKLIWRLTEAYITNSMDHIYSWEADSSSANQEISGILWNPEVHYRIHKKPPPDPILNQINLVHAPLFHFLGIHFNITLSFMPKRCGLSLSLKSLYPNPVCASPFPHQRMSRQFRSSWFDQTNNIWCGVQIIKFLVMESFPFPCFLIHLRP